MRSVVVNGTSTGPTFWLRISRSQSMRCSSVRRTLCSLALVPFLSLTVAPHQKTIDEFGLWDAESPSYATACKPIADSKAHPGAGN